MEEQNAKEISSTEAVLMGALAPGVNEPTWSVLKMVFVLLAFSLTAMLALAFISSDFVIVGNVIFLIVIGAVLFVLLAGFLEQTGLVSVEQQMKDIGLTKEEIKKDE